MEAKRRFTALKRQYNKTQKVLKEHGRSSKEAAAQLEKLGEAYSPFKLVPRHFDEMVDMARRGLNRVRRQERLIMPSVCARLVYRGQYSARPMLATKPASPG